jgi:hypothetical protein
MESGNRAEEASGAGHGTPDGREHTNENTHQAPRQEVGDDLSSKSARKMST